MRLWSISFFFNASVVSLVTGILILANMGDLQIDTPMWIPTLFAISMLLTVWLFGLHFFSSLDRGRSSFWKNKAVRVEP
jgi:hypothetical protein